MMYTGTTRIGTSTSGWSVPDAGQRGTGMSVPPPPSWASAEYDGPPKAMSSVPSPSTSPASAADWPNRAAGTTL